MICHRCAGSGSNPHSGFACDKCGGSGWIDWMDILMPWAVALLVAGVALTAGNWLWHLFAK
jgi:hypothetical protein